jgi:ABC-type phosphate transport system auxiliary subunit
MEIVNITKILEVSMEVSMEGSYAGDPGKRLKYKESQAEKPIPTVEGLDARINELKEQSVQVIDYFSTEIRRLNERVSELQAKLGRYDHTFDILFQEEINRRLLLTNLDLNSPFTPNECTQGSQVPMYDRLRNKLGRI